MTPVEMLEPAQLEPAADDRLCPAEHVLVAASAVAALIFVIVGITRPIWLDEAMAALIGAQTPVAIVDSLSRENNQPFFYLLLSLWMRCFGDSEIAMRSLTAVFYLLGSGVACALGRRVAGTRRAAYYSGFFYLASALAIRQAHSIRMYSLLGLLSGLSTLTFMRLFWERDRRSKTWILYVTVNAVGLLTHIWFVFVLFAQFAVLAATAWRELWRWTLAAGLAALPFAVFWGRTFLGQLHNGATSWMPQLRPIFVVYASLEFYYPIATLALYFIAIAAFRIHRHRGLVLLAAIFALTVATPLLVSIVRPVYWPGRYAIIALPPLAAFLGCTLASHLPRRLLASVGLLLLVIQVTSHIRARESAPDTELPAGQNDRTTAQFLLTHAALGDAVVFTSLTRAAADYYFHRAQAAGRFTEVSYPREVATHMGSLELTLTPARRLALEGEADVTVGDLQSLALRGASVWLYDGFAANLSGILKERLDRALVVRREYPLQGPYHRRLLQYRARAEAAIDSH